jgi:hypothetical protein
VRVRRITIGVSLIAIGAIAFLVFGFISYSPPAAVLSTQKGGDVLGVEAGTVTVSSSAQQKLLIDFATEVHLSGSTTSPVVMELRAPRTGGYVDCEGCDGGDCEGCGGGPLIVNLEFEGSADSEIFGIEIIEQDVQAAFGSTSGGEGYAWILGADDYLDVGSIEVPGSDEPRSVVQLEFAKSLFISRAADRGWTTPLVRISVTPRIPNTTANGQYFAVQAPVVETLPSNRVDSVHSPFNSDGGPLWLYPVVELQAPRGLVDDTGAAIVTGALSFEDSWSVSPTRLPEESGPVISYIDQRVAQQVEYWRQLAILLAAAFISTGGGILVELFIGKASATGEKAGVGDEHNAVDRESRRGKDRDNCQAVGAWGVPVDVPEPVQDSERERQDQSEAAEQDEQRAVFGHARNRTMDE